MAGRAASMSSLAVIFVRFLAGRHQGTIVAQSSSRSASRPFVTAGRFERPCPGTGQTQKSGSVFALAWVVRTGGERAATPRQLLPIGAVRPHPEVRLEGPGCLFE